MNPDTSNRRQNIYIVIAAIVAIIVVWLAFTSGGGGGSIDTPDESSSIDYSQQASLVNDKDLLTQVKGVVAYDQLSVDLRTFGQTAYKAYATDSKKVVGFKVNKAPKTDGKTVSFSGSFGSSGNTVDVTVTVLGNSRIRTSITDKKTKLNIDEYLPSNSKRNAFIATLPVSTSTYNLDYNQTDDSFALELYPETSNAIDAAYDEATSLIVKSTGITNIRQEDLTIIRAGFDY